MFLTRDVYNQMRNGERYRGPVVVQDLRERDGSFDESKFFFGVSTADQARAIDASSFAKRSDYDARDAKNQYTTISSGQMDVWKYSISENPDLMKESFVEWATSNWGTLERFNGIFGDMQEVSRAQYRTIVGIAQGADGRLGTADDLSVKDIQAQIAGNAAFARPDDAVARR